MDCWKWVPSTNLERLKTSQKVMILDNDADYLETYNVDIGKEVVNWPPEGKTFRVDTNGQVFDLLDSSDGLHIVSEKLKIFLEENTKDAIQFLPIRVVDKKGQPMDIGQYFVLNCLTQISGSLDLEHSQFHFDRFGRISQIWRSGERIVFKDDMVREHDIFRAEEMAFTLLVNIELKEKLSHEFPCLLFFYLRERFVDE